MTLPGDRDLPPGARARLRRQVVNEVRGASRPVPSRRRRTLVVGGSLAALLLGGGTVAAVAGGLAVWRMDSGVVGIDQNRLDPYYKGRVITPAELERLQEQGKAKYPVSAPEYACKGYVPHFDTEAEADADFMAYAERTRARGAPAPGQVGPSATGDPCERFKDPSPAASPTPSSDEERDGTVKAGPTVRLKETDEFGLVVKAERRDGAVRVTVDRVDSLGGEEAERAAAADGTDVSNDHYEVNDNPRTRDYVLADDPDIWQANPSDVGSPKPMTVAEWLAYVRTPPGRRAMFHFDVHNGRVVGIEEQYFP